MVTKDRLSSIFWLIIGLYVCLHSYKLGLGKPSSPGPGFIFFLAGTLFSVLSAIDLLGCLFSKGKESETREQLWSGLKWQKIIVVLSSTFAYIFFFNLLGFPLSTFLLMILFFRIVESTKWWVVILTALITVSTSYIVFDLLLKIPFPKGFVGI